MHNDDSAEGFDTLEDLIRYLEAERDLLKTVVEDAAREWEFSVARSYAKASRQVYKRLEVLKGLRDPNYESVRIITGGWSVSRNKYVNTGTC